MQEPAVQQARDAGEAFVWSSKYETGIELVDTQHRNLVALINRVGEAQQQSQPSFTIEPILEELAAYARDHFATEHRLMRDAGLHEDYVRNHVSSHASFVKQLDLMRACLEDAPEQLVPDLLRYLITWLAEHILVEDQAMAWQVRAIQGGMSPRAASAWATGKANPSHDALVEAMYRMYSGIAQRNAELRLANQRLRERELQLEQARRELAQLNTGLGTRVAERTAEIYETQLRLQEEYETRRLLARQLEQAQRELDVRADTEACAAVIDSARRELDGLAAVLATARLQDDAAARARSGMDRLRDALYLLRGPR